MAFQAISKKTGKTYFLHQCVQSLKNGTGTVTLYYFSGTQGPDAIDALPDGYEVGENTKTGLPILRKKK